MSSSGILAAYSPTPATGSSVQRGSAVGPPARSMRRQKSHPPFATVTASLRSIAFSSCPTGRVASPSRVCRDLLSLHEERVGGEHRPVAQRRAVVDQCADAEGAASAERAAVRLEGAVLLRVALDHAARIEDAVVADGGESPLRDVGAVIEDPPADPNTQQPPDHVLERRAVERVEVIDRGHLPEALVAPELRVVHRAIGGRERAKSADAALYQHEVQHADREVQREKRSRAQIRERTGKLEGRQIERREEEDAQPPGEKEEAHGPEVVPVLCPETPPQLLALAEMVEPAVAVDGSRNLETRGAEQPDPFANPAVERNHHLRREQTVVAGPPSRGVGDVVAHEAAGPDRRSGHAERRARDLVV